MPAGFILTNFNGQWLIDWYKPDGQYQLSLTKGMNKDRNGQEVDCTTKQQLKQFVNDNLVFLKNQFVKLGTTYEQEII